MQFSLMLHTMLSQPLQSYTNTILPYVTTIYHNPYKVTILIQFSLMLQQSITTPTKLY